MEENQSFDESTEEMISEAERTLFSELAISDSARAFFHSPIGQYVMAAIQQDIDSGMKKLYETPMWRKRKCQDIKNDIKAREAIISIFNDAITQGDTAHQMLLESRGYPDAYF